MLDEQAPAASMHRAARVDAESCHPRASLTTSSIWQARRTQHGGRPVTTGLPWGEATMRGRATSVPEPDRTLFAGGHRRNPCTRLALPCPACSRSAGLSSPSPARCSPAPSRAPRIPRASAAVSAATGDARRRLGARPQGLALSLRLRRPAPLRLLRPDPLGLRACRQVAAALVVSPGEQGDAASTGARASRRPRVLLRPRRRLPRRDLRRPRPGVARAALGRARTS